MRIPLNEISTPGLFRLLQDVAAELEARSTTAVVRHVPSPQDWRPVRTLCVPEEDDADFCLMIAARVKAGGYVKVGERERVAKIAEKFGSWVIAQGLPTTRNAGDWKRRIEAASAPRSRMR